MLSVSRTDILYHLVLIGSFVHLVQELCLVLRLLLLLLVRDAMSTMVTQTEVWEVGDSEPAVGLFLYRKDAVRLA